MHTAAELLKQGYRPGAPSKQAEIDDREIAESMTCPACEKDTLRYRPWSRKSPYSYIAIAACDKCGHEEEF